VVEQAFTGFVALPRRADARMKSWAFGRGATDEEIDAAYRSKAKTAHPDSSGLDVAMHELNEARRKLMERAA
jgi:hypothetical protein